MLRAVGRWIRQRVINARKRRFKRFFAPKNERAGSRKVVQSPSGTYALEISRFGTKSGWNFSQGTVRQAGIDKPIAVIRRNYGSFPYLFIERHANGRDYLVAGEDYQGQTVIELDTGKRRDSLSEGAHDGIGFC